MKTLSHHPQQTLSFGGVSEIVHKLESGKCGASFNSKQLLLFEDFFQKENMRWMFVCLLLLCSFNLTRRMEKVLGKKANESNAQLSVGEGEDRLRSSRSLIFGGNRLDELGLRGKKEARCCISWP